MKTIFTAAALAAALLSLPAIAADVTKGAIKISTPWTRVAPGGAKVAVGFVTITNTGSSPDRLIGGSVPFAGKVEVHEMTMEGNIMRMRMLANGLEIKPGATVVLKPGSYHLMFMQLKGPIAMGEPIKGTLQFEKAGQIEIEYQVAKIGARGPDGAVSGDHDGGMGGMPGHMKH